MADRTTIEWCRGEDGRLGATWNPIRARNLETDGIGHYCVHVSEGCRNCYAERMQPRFRNFTRYAVQDRGKIELFLHDDALTQPLRWRKPRHVFVCSMTDLFLDDHADEWIDRVFAVMALCPQHTFQVLTKRPERMRKHMRDEGTPFRVAQEMDALRSRATTGPEKVRPINGFPGYFASSHGHIYSEMRGQRRRMRPDAGAKDINESSCIERDALIGEASAARAPPHT